MNDYLVTFMGEDTGGDERILSVKVEAANPTMAVYTATREMFWKMAGWKADRVVVSPLVDD